MGTYSIKRTDYYYKEKISIYKSPIIYDEKYSNVTRQKYDDMTIDKKKKSDERRIRYYKKKVADTIEIAMMNEDLDTAITLTFKESITSYDIAVSKWQSFLKRLRHYIEPISLKYICVWEIQKARSENEGITNGGVFHFHFLTNTGFIEHSILEKLWGNGFVWVEKLGSLKRRENAIRYTTKYCLKELVERVENNEDDRGKRFIFTSNNLLKPIHYVYENLDITLEDIIIEKLEHIIKDGQYDIKDMCGKVINQVEFVEYEK